MKKTRDLRYSAEILQSMFPFQAFLALCLVAVASADQSSSQSFSLGGAQLTSHESTHPPRPQGPPPPPPPPRMPKYVSWILLAIYGFDLGLCPELISLISGMATHGLWQ